jgi:DNA-binding winged helix-turn-helix (wHTH) protein
LGFSVLAFGPFQLDLKSRRLLREREPVPLGARQFDLLHVFATRPRQILSKDSLIEAAWRDVAVTDNSLEQAISGLRRLLGPDYIETHARRGYRFAADVTRSDVRETDDALDALLAPHRMWIEGRAALETLARDQILHARDVFERVVAQVPEQAPAHVGLANACVMQFEMTRTDVEPDRRALQVALTHAREACHLDAQYGEAWVSSWIAPAITPTRWPRFAAPSRSKGTTGGIASACLMRAGAKSGCAKHGGRSRCCRDFRLRTGWRHPCTWPGRRLAKPPAS